MAMLPNEEINRIQKSANIVDIIGSYINLEKQGKNYFCVCPFHEDHNPSMSVNEEKQIYTCFVCHATGNVFTFVQNYENISFIDAVRNVASKVGIELDAGYKSVSKYEKHYEALDYATKYYQNNLKSADGKLAREYLKKRGLNEDIIDEFNIGLAPKASDNVTKLLLGKGYDEQVLLDTGITNRGNTLYDLFRNRITFPIHNVQGKVVGYSCRIYEEVNEAKYINTRETPIFKKGEILFNYHRAQNEARRVKELVIVEGQMDAIRVYASGIKNVVATMGTALTNEHVKLLKKLNVKVILCMDNDAAGEKATLQTGEMLEKANIDLAVLRLSGEKDPDEYILKNGINAYKDAIKNSISYFDFKLNYLKKNKNLNKVDDVSSYINQVILELNKKNDDVLTNLTINKLANDYGVDKSILLNKVVKVASVPVVAKVQQTKKIRLDKNHKLCDNLLFYMMSDEKYLKLYENELSYIPDPKYAAIADDLIAFDIKYNYVGISDFITYEINGDNYENVLDIIDNNINTEINDDDFIGLIEKIKHWVDESRIQELKNKLKTVTDINEKLKINDEIVKIKRRMCE